MEVYVLLGRIDYEGTSLLGVYHTKEDAEFSRDEYIKTHRKDRFDDYEIKLRVIGARARTNSEI